MCKEQLDNKNINNSIEGNNDDPEAIIKMLLTKLANAQQSYMIGIDKARSEVKAQFENEIESLNKKLEFTMQENIILQDKYCKAHNMLNNIKEKGKEELIKAKAEINSQFDFSKELLELCGKIEKCISGELVQLNILLNSSNNIDYVCIDRIQNMIEAFKDIIIKISMYCDNIHTGIQEPFESICSSNKVPETHCEDGNKEYVTIVEDLPSDTITFDF